MPNWYDFDRFYAPSTPRAAKGGIRAQSTRGAFGESWWAKRWISVLEGFGIGSRMQRGRNYARRGQVLSVDVAKGSVAASVQGSRPKPYDITIGVKALDKTVWTKVAACVAGQAIFASKLLGGEMPREIENAFLQCGQSLFPSSYRDLTTRCSCPDSANPCKHIAAVYYLLGEEFDRDPFLIFRVRGMEREEFLAMLGGYGTQHVSAAPVLAPEPLPADPSRFWTTAPLPEHLAPELFPHRAGAGLAKRLGKFPFWRGQSLLQDFLERVYIDAAGRAERTLSQESDKISAEG